jgi:hypothetical protein
MGDGDAERNGQLVATFAATSTTNRSTTTASGVEVIAAESQDT